MKCADCCYCWKEDDEKARSCKHCTDTADSFNRYVSTYCHLRQEHIAGADKDLLDRCMACELYERRT